MNNALYAWQHGDPCGASSQSTQGSRPGLVVYTGCQKAPRRRRGQHQCAARSRTQGSFTWPPPGHRPRVMWQRRRLLQIACQPRLTATMASRQTGVQIDGHGHRCARCPRRVDEGAAIAAGPDRPNRAKAARLRPQKGCPWSASADNRRRRCIVARCE